MAALDLTGNLKEVGQVRGFLCLQLGTGPVVALWALNTGFSWAEKKAHLHLPAPVTLVPLPLNSHPPLHSDTLSPEGLFPSWPSASLLLVHHVHPASSPLSLLLLWGQSWTHPPVRKEPGASSGLG